MLNGVPPTTADGPVTMEQIGAMAARRLVSDLQRSLPRVAARMLRWRPLDTLAGNGLAARSFPVLWFPYWLASAEARATDLGFQTDVACSSLSGYCYVRLIDDVADGDHPDAVRKLLPAAGYFAARFQAEYAKYFAHDHPFWATFHDAWQRQADAAAADANLVDVTREQFDTITARKCDAAEIPIAAAGLRYALPGSAIADWQSFASATAAVHQMMNDVLGWRSDLQHGIGTFVLSTFRRSRRVDETPEAWFRREGLAWATHTVADLFAEAEEKASPLGGGDPAAWLVQRRDAWRADVEAEAARLDAAATSRDAPMRSASVAAEGNIS